MRAAVHNYDMVAPATLTEALDLLACEPGVWTPFAGGTDLMVLFEAGALEPRRFLSLWRLSELKGITVGDEHLTLGALTTYTEVRRHPVVASEFPLLAEAARQTGGLATQNRGTLGGNIMNASPAADTPPALLVYDAEVELASRAASRWVPYAAFHTGYKRTVLRPEEVLARIRLPREAPGARHYYRKVGTRHAQAISKVCFAGLLRLDGVRVAGVRVALASVAPAPLRALRTEETVRGRALTPELVAAAQAQLAAEISPIDDLRSTARYRTRVAQNLLGDFLLPGTV